jgi:hypothetical protein
MVTWYYEWKSKSLEHDKWFAHEKWFRIIGSWVENCFRSVYVNVSNMDFSKYKRNFDEISIES